MDEYKKMYGMLFNKITDIIGELQAAQQEAEEMFLSPGQAGERAREDPGGEDTD
jgi:hypothetical protein